MTPRPAHPSAGRIRVLLVDDSPLALEVIRRMLAGAADIEVAGTAANGVEALERIARLRPDVLCTDLHMPTMDGLRLTQAVMARHPLPILVMSTSLQANQRDNIFALLEAGAVDILAKPLGGLEADFGVMAHELATKIRVLAGVKVFRRRPGAEASAAAPCAPAYVPGAGGAARIVGIGASTGGPQALATLFGALPADFPLPLLCAQHIAPGFTQGLVKWLAGVSRIRVCSAQEGDRPAPGHAYFPPDNRHLELGESGRLHCSDSLPVDGYRPNTDLLLSSLARGHGAGAVGILLTGMGQDGAQGMLDIFRAGGQTIAQDEQSSTVFGMPRRAIELNAARHVLPLDQIGPCLLRLAGVGPERA